MSCSTVLKQKGFKLTPQRRFILEYIHNNESHLTAEEIINYVEDRVPGVNKSTVYRTLDLLEESGCVIKNEVDGRFIYHHAEEGHHHHLICRSCGKSIDCENDIFLSIKRNLVEKYGFHADFKHVILNGQCNECFDK